ncbi:MAG: hypothetical protein CUN51_01445 [Candidatus Thermofonsia Clade 1 bacterium]|uniref:PepSY domain-containing protein n=1 Tax=Candidatus Thermofonsia Clade 1 bacterium TaxID=2364210 RepID=A0A2M8P444_9CHLR|nr:MAG: hypothetical protein CUN51_01445 [Candidatus Thermofonsia Clade 1 bacterium]
MKKHLVTTIVLAMLVILSVPTAISKAQELISLQEAISIAQGLYPNTEVVKTELVQSAQTPYYIIGLSNGKSVYINATTKEIIQITTTQALSVGGLAAPPLNVVPPAAPVVPPAAGTGAFISYEQALQVVQSRFPGAQPLDVKLERKGRKHGYATVWNFKLNNGYEVEVNAANGTIFEIKPMRRWPYTIDPANAAISQAQAEQIASSNFGGSAVFSRLKQLGRQDGYALVWEVTLNNGYRVEVNATTGAIVKVRGL